MKKIVSVVLCVLLFGAICTALAGGAGSSSDPLISLSYITDAFKPNTVAEGKKEINSALGSVYSAAVGGLSSGAPQGYTATKGGVTVTLKAGDAISIASGSTIALTSGSASYTAKSGSVTDVTNGKTLSNGATITPGVRCLALSGAEALFTATADTKAVVNGYYKLAGGQAPAALPFTDVSSDQWFYDAVSFVYNNHYMNGLSETEFGVSVYTSRAVFVTALYRMAGEPSVTEISPFSDVTDSSAFYYAPVIWSNKNGIVLGHEDGTFRPNDSITREQMAAIMHRYVKYAGYDVSNTDDTVFNSFPDKDKVNDYAKEPMKWATANKIINGMDGTLNPGGTAIRAQVAQIILNFYKYMA